MDTLVINLTRFGDLLQTQPVLSGFAEQGRVGLVCLDNFRFAAELLEGSEAVFPLPGASFLSSMDKSWRTGLSAFRRFVGEVAGDFPAGRIVNLTPTIPARLLSLCLGTKDAAGFGLDRHGFSVHSGPWAVFLQTASANRGCSPFNVVDIFRRVAGLPPAHGCFSLARPPESEVAKARALLAADAPEGVKGFVALQLGASEDRRRWPLEYFARLGRLLWEELSLAPVLLGSSGERVLSERFAALAGYPHVDRIGRTSMPELAATLACAKLLVSNDTGTMHLAAGLGVPVAAIFLATAQPWDTGPYSVGSLSLEPDLPCHPCGFGQACTNGLACRWSIQPETVFGHVRSWLAQGEWGRAETHGARAWLAGVDRSGYLGLRSLSGLGGDDRTAWVELQRFFLRRFLDGEPFQAAPGEPVPGIDDPAAVEELKAACDLMTLLVSQAALLARDPRPALKSKFLGYWQRTQATLARSRRLSVLGNMLLYEMQERSTDIGGLLACLRGYHALLAGISSAVRQPGMEVDKGL